MTYLVWIRTEHPEDELYRVASADSLDEVLSVIAGAGVTMDRVRITRPVTVGLTEDGNAKSSIGDSPEVQTAVRNLFKLALDGLSMPRGPRGQS